MPTNSQKDLFDDSTMSFGEHLEELRVRLWRGLIGLALGVVAMLFVGDRLLAVIRRPIDNALQSRGIKEYTEAEGETKIEDRNWKDYYREFFGSSPKDEEEQEKERKKSQGETDKEIDQGILVELRARDLAWQLHESYPDTYKAPPADDERKIRITLWAEQFAQFKRAREMALQPITLTVQEAFMTYIKVSVVAGLVLSAPWLFYQIWMFVAAGLYPHEKKYVYVFLPISTILFLTGAFFCFFAVFPFVLQFLLSFNDWLDTAPQIRLSEWISFAIVLPVMFGLSFQLPLVMLFLERITVFEVKTYQEQRRMAILVIAIISMLLTPADPMSMMLMMIPLCLLYELGIMMCRMMESKQPFKPETV
jgi:sec-independent protein translocase protein TatC